MGEPLTHSEIDTGHADSALNLAMERFERALGRLETALELRPAAQEPGVDVERTETLVVELGAARRRQSELTRAAADVSAVLGRAMAEVRQTLEEDGRRQGLLDLGAPQPIDAPHEPPSGPPRPSQGLEVEAGSPDEGVADSGPPEEESTA